MRSAYLVSARVVTKRRRCWRRCCSARDQSRGKPIDAPLSDDDRHAKRRAPIHDALPTMGDTWPTGLDESYADGTTGRSAQPRRRSSQGRGCLTRGPGSGNESWTSTCSGRPIRLPSGRRSASAGSSPESMKASTACSRDSREHSASTLHPDRTTTSGAHPTSRRQSCRAR